MCVLIIFLLSYSDKNSWFGGCLTWRVGRRLLLGEEDGGFLILTGVGRRRLTNTGYIWTWNIYICLLYFFHPELLFFTAFSVAVCHFIQKKSSLSMKGFIFYLTEQCWAWTGNIILVCHWYLASKLSNPCKLIMLIMLYTPEITTQEKSAGNSAKNITTANTVFIKYQ